MSLEYKNGNLTWDGMSLSTVAEEYGTPAYVYSRKVIEEDYLRLKNTFGTNVDTLCYALKANSNPEIVKLLGELGSGADIVSKGELLLALKSGISPDKIVFAGVGKTDEEIKLGMESKLLAINVESVTELEIIEDFAKEMNVKQPIMLRTNPNVDAETHPYISTGLGIHKFGIDIEKIEELTVYCSKSEYLDFKGLHVHIGSQIEKKEPVYENFEIIADLIERIEKRGVAVPVLDLGGGIAVNYRKDFDRLINNIEPEPENDCDTIVEHWAKAIEKSFGKNKRRIVLEPGRPLVARSGILLTKVLYRKERQGKEFVIVDAAANDFMRPILYDAFHGIVPLKESGEKLITTDVVGPICETGDFFAHNITIPDCERGDYLAILSTGAYGFTESSNYNLRTKPPEVLIENGSLRCIRPRQKYDDIN